MRLAEGRVEEGRREAICQQPLQRPCERNTGRRSPHGGREPLPCRRPGGTALLPLLGPEARSHNGRVADPPRQLVGHAAGARRRADDAVLVESNGATGALRQILVGRPRPLPAPPSLPLQRANVLVPPLLRKEVARVDRVEAISARELFRRGAPDLRVPLGRRNVETAAAVARDGGSARRLAPQREILVAVLEDPPGEQDGVADVAEAHDADAALLAAAGHHDGRLQLVDAVAGEDGAVPAVEERVVL